MISLGNLLIAQSNSLTTDNWDQLVEKRLGEDDLLVNGRRYFPANPRADGHPYYPSDSWSEGQVYIKGRIYEGLNLKYDLEKRQLLLRDQLVAGGYEIIILNEGLVDSFDIGGHHFVLTKYLLAKPDNDYPYFEQLYDGNFQLLLKHQLVFKSTVVKDGYIGKYYPPEQIRYLLSNGKLTKVQGKKSLLNYFPTHKTAIKQFLKKNKIRYKKATADELILLMKFCDEL